MSKTEMFYLEDTKNEIMRVTDASVNLSLDCALPDFKKGMICIAPASLEAGICFDVRAILRGAFSFTAQSDSIIKTLCLTIRNSGKNFRKNVKRFFYYFSERAENAVRSTVPRFRRL